MARLLLENAQESATWETVTWTSHWQNLVEAAVLRGARPRVAAACDEGECDKAALIDLLDLAESLQMAKLTVSAARALSAVDPESERAAKVNEALFAEWQATEKALAA